MIIPEILETEMWNGQKARYHRYQGCNPTRTGIVLIPLPLPQRYQGYQRYQTSQADQTD
jgi:hypothetical protein